VALLRLYIVRFCFSIFYGFSLIAAPIDDGNPRTLGIEESQWDLSKMYASQEDWEAHYKKVESMIKDFAAKAGQRSGVGQTHS